MTLKQDYYDCLIIGTGIAGLFSVLSLPPNLSIALISKDTIEKNNSSHAQGGIACVANEVYDDFQQHILDTISAGDGLCDEKVVKQVIESGPKVLKKLIDWGVVFSKNEQTGKYILAKEGGHSQRRILHNGDMTGEAIIKGLIQELKTRKNITIFEHHICIDLISHKIEEKNSYKTCGAYFLDKKNNDIKVLSANHTILATGGAGKVYRNTTNPSIATGDGIAIAHRAGLKIKNMEFFQFHPTALCFEGEKPFLISEAVRGDGAKLLVKDKDQFVEFMKGLHPLANLAPRDIVARTIDKELKRTGQKTIFLDLTHLEKEYLEKRFPKIYYFCRSKNIYIEKDFIPVVPAAHYCCGGVLANIDGSTALLGLSVIGESACTGLHGANRLASNSLLEAIVMAENCANSISQLNFDAKDNFNIPHWVSPYKYAKNMVIISHNWAEVRAIMWDYVGIFRSNDLLKTAKKKLTIIRKEVETFYYSYQINSDLLELRNLLTIAELIVNSALKRKESRGLHYNSNYPEKSKKIVNTLI